MNFGLDKKIVKKMQGDFNKIKIKLIKERKAGKMYENMGQREIMGFMDKYRDFRYYEEADKIITDLNNFVKDLWKIN